MDNRQPHRLRRAWQNFKETAAIWRVPGIAGIIGTVGSWTVWYYSSVPCTMAAALAGVCNPGVFASYITLPVLTSCLGIGAGCATLAGGYNFVMLNRERQRADAAEERAILAQERAIKAEERSAQVADEVRERLFQIEEERSAEHRQVMQERRQMEQERLQMERERHEEHRQFMAAQRAMLEAVTQLVQRQNGRHSNDADPQQ